MGEAIGLFFLGVVVCFVFSVPISWGVSRGTNNLCERLEAIEKQLKELNEEKTE